MPDLTLGVDTLVGGGMGALVLGMAGVVMRRTKDMDEMRDRLIEQLVDYTGAEIAGARERAAFERAEADRLRNETAELRGRIAALEQRGPHG